MAERSDRWERWPVVWGRAHPVWGRAHPRWRRSRPGRAVRARPAWRLTVAVVVVASAPAVAVAGLGLALLAPPATAATPGYHDVVPARTQALRPTGLRLRATPEVAVHGSETTLTATLVRAGTSTGVPGQRVRFDVRPAGGTAWTRIGGARTSAAGGFN